MNKIKSIRNKSFDKLVEGDEVLCYGFKCYYNSSTLDRSVLTYNFKEIQFLFRTIVNWFYFIDTQRTVYTIEMHRCKLNTGAKNKWTLLRKNGLDCTVVLRKYDSMCISIDGKSSVLTNKVVYQNVVTKQLYDTYLELSRKKKADLVNFIYSRGYVVKSKIFRKKSLITTYMKFVLREIYDEMNRPKDNTQKIKPEDIDDVNSLINDILEFKANQKS